jgi:glycogen synthase
MLGWEFPPHITGGLGVACAGLARALVEQGVDVVFLVPRVFGDEDAGGARLVAANAAHRGRASAYAAAEPLFTGRYGGLLFDEVARFADAAERLAGSERFDLVHAHDWMSWPAAQRAARTCRAPLVVHVHSLESDRSGPRSDPRIVAVERAGIAAAAAVVCVSRTTAAEVHRVHGTPWTKLRVVHNAVPLMPRAPLRLRRFDEPVVLFLGRVTYQKGPEAFLGAAQRVVDVEPRVKFVVAGEGDLLPSLVERAAALGLARHVHFTGFLDARDVERAYADADVYVMPSVSEPFGIAPLEAAARGVPVVLSRRSGVAEVLSGALVADSWDVEDLANKILALIRRPALVAELVERGRQDVRRLTWERQGALLVEVYDHVMGRSGQ